MIKTIKNVRSKIGSLSHWAASRVLPFYKTTVH